MKMNPTRQKKHDFYILTMEKVFDSKPKPIRKIRRINIIKILSSLI